MSTMVGPRCDALVLLYSLSCPLPCPASSDLDLDLDPSAAPFPTLLLLRDLDREDEVGGSKVKGSFLSLRDQAIPEN